ncbi:hypothetical protein AGMMS50268_41220 [Spirochaetia bacterium]|nr:hypothetical protein AGMMS50268_41220 [Spirochaetia bacterium]
MVIDFKKIDKQFYQPKTKPEIIDVPEMVFIMIDGQGDPNTSADYANAVQVLYGLSYAIRMNKALTGYFDYVVPPLEGMWWHKDGGVIKDISDKGSFAWTSMIRLPAFVHLDVFEAAKITLSKKKPELDLSAARLERFTEGLCAQIMHIGSYDNEPDTTAVLEEFITTEGLHTDFSDKRRHHEIYLGDPRKTMPDKLRTVIRYPIAKEKSQ